MVSLTDSLPDDSLPDEVAPEQDLAEQVQYMSLMVQELQATVNSIQADQQNILNRMDHGLTPSPSDMQTILSDVSSAPAPERDEIFTFPHRFTAYNHNNEDNFRLCGFIETPLSTLFRVEHDFTLAFRMRLGHVGCDAAILSLEGPEHDGHLIRIGFFRDKPELVATIRQKLPKSNGECIPSEFHTMEVQSTNGWRMPSGTWHHVALVKSAAQMTLHVDGELVGGKEIPRDVVYYTTKHPRLCIGRTIWKGKSCNQFDGSIENVKVWNRVLEESEMRRECANESILP